MHKPSDFIDLSLDLSHVSILVVDDDPDSRAVMGVILEHYGAHVCNVASASEALTLVSQIKFDVLLTDIIMPQIDGYELIQKVRDLLPEHCQQIVAIAVTGCTDEVNQQQIRAAGFQQYLKKPFELEELVRTIATLVTSRQEELELCQPILKR